MAQFCAETCGTGCIICGACNHCWSYAVMRKVKHSMNKCCPSLCPIRDTERIWCDSRFKGEQKKQATCLAYVAREHSLLGIFFAPYSRPTDLMPFQLFMIFGLNVVAAAYLCMWVAGRFPEWMTGWRWYFTLVFINSGAAIAKVMYRSGIKRTYFCNLKLLDISLPDRAPPSASSGSADLPQLTLMVKLAGVEREVGLSWSPAEGRWCPEDGASLELQLPLRYTSLQIALVETAEEKVGIFRRRKVISRVLGIHEVDVEELGLVLDESRPYRLPLEPFTPLRRGSSARYFGILKSGSKACMGDKASDNGCLACQMKLGRDEPIAVDDLVTSAARPITECCLVKAMGWLVIGPPYLLVKMRRHGLRYLTRRIPKSDHQRSCMKFSGRQWRIALRLFALGWIASVTVCYVFYVVFRTGSVEEQKRVEHATKLFLEVKLASWFVTEPGALMWTYLTMRSCCPSFLPEQGAACYERGDDILLPNPLAAQDESNEFDPDGCVRPPGQEPLLAV